MEQMVLRQTTALSRQLQQLDSETNFQKLAGRLKAHLELGDVIPGAGGLRKIRMALPGKGSQGGARIIYIWIKEAGELFFLWLYSKGAAEDLNPKKEKALAAMAAQIKLEYQKVKKKRGG